MGLLAEVNIEQIDNIGKIKLMSLRNWCSNEGLVVSVSGWKCIWKLATLMVSNNLFVRAMKTFFAA